MALSDSFWARVQKTDDCWLWTGAKYKDGYGAFAVVIGGRWRTRRAHRLAFEDSGQEIPDGLVLDHICHNADECAGGNDCVHRRCVNPSHLEPVTKRVNTLRGSTLPGRNHLATQCINGHPFTPENTYLWGRNGSRSCRACGAENARRYRQDKRRKASHVQEDGL